MNGIIHFTNVMAILIAIYTGFRGVSYMWGDYNYNHTAAGRLKLLTAQMRGLKVTFPWPKNFAIMIVCIVWVICV